MATIVPAQQTAIANLYTALFNRAPDAAGFGFWVQSLSNGASLASITSAFLTAPESKAIYPASQTSEQFITTFYTNVFGRAPDQAGLAFWAGVVNANGGSSSDAAKAVAITQIINIVSTPLTTKPADITDAQYAQTVADRGTFMNKSTVGVYYAVEAKGTSLDAAKQVLVGVNSTDASVTAAKLLADNSAGGGTSTTLTTGVDNLVGTAGNDTFSGYINGQTPTTSTLTAADQISGGAGVDTLSLTLEGNVAGALPAATITGIEQFLIRDVGTAASTFNFANVEGETKVTSNLSSNAVTFQNLGTGAVVALQGNNSATLGAVSFSMNTASDAVSLSLAGGLKGATNITNNNGTATKATVTSTGAANNVGTVVLAGAATNTITSLTIDAATALKATLTANDFASNAALVVTGAGRVDLGTTVGFDGATIDASASTGGIVIAASSNLTNFKGSATNDILNGVAGTVIANTAVIDAGAGIDSVAAVLVNAGNSAVFKNFEQVELAGATGTLDAALLTGSTISGITISGAMAGGFVLSNLVETTSGFNVGVTASAGQNTTLGFTAASVVGTADVLNLNFTAADAAAATTINAGTITAQGIETININSKGGTLISNQVALIDNAAKAIVITGDKALTVSIQQTVGATAVAPLLSVDGSAATGNLNITVSGPAVGLQGALVVKGGSGADTITVSTVAGATSVGATVTTGAGNDIVNVTGATVVSATAPQFTTITDFAKGDAIQFAGAHTAFTATAVNVSAATTLLDALQLANSATANTVQWFNYGGDTYIVDSAVNTGGAIGVALDVTDVVVKIGRAHV